MALRNEGATGPQPYGKKKALSDHRKQHESERVRPETKERGVEIGMQGGIAREKVPVDVKTVQRGKRLVGIHVRDIATGRKLQNQENDGVEAEAAQCQSPDGEPVEELLRLIEECAGRDGDSTSGRDRCPQRDSQFETLRSCHWSLDGGSGRRTAKKLRLLNPGLDRFGRRVRLNKSL